MRASLWTSADPGPDGSSSRAVVGMTWCTCRMAALQRGCSRSEFTESRALHFRFLAWAGMVGIWPACLDGAARHARILSPSMVLGCVRARVISKVRVLQANASRRTHFSPRIYILAHRASPAKTNAPNGLPKCQRLRWT